ncbi:MAG TPA: hypothetical protein VGP13_03645 [Candidatus Paceibacterota bacterium]|jgi:hypothetical protein|nr:hypothetical protein [Candidatus Paceibacterota bacterium]
MVGETIDRSDEVRPTSPPPKPPLQITHQPEQQTPAKSASESSQQAYTDRTSEIIDAHQQPDGSYGAALPPSQQITHQPQKPTGTAVAVTSMGGKGWTPPEIKEAKGIEKKELQKMFKKEIGELKQELKKDLKEKTDKIESSLARNRIGVPPPLNKAAVEERRKAQDVSQRKEWLDKERQRMSGPIINSAPLSTTNPPPAPPPPPSTQPGGAEPTEDNKK